MGNPALASDCVFSPRAPLASKPRALYTSQRIFLIGTHLTAPFDDMLFAAIVEAARAAGTLALGFFRPDAQTSAAVAYKAGNSPVTEADRQADALLKHRLCALVPQAAWLSEETPDGPARLGAATLFIVDPIDGTRAFMSGDRRWAVSVALVEHGRPVMAVVHAPALGQTFAAALGRGAWLNNGMIKVADAAPAAGLRLAAPKFLADALRQDGLDFALVPKIPSLAWRFASVAAGWLDIGLASPQAHEWDIAAADLILHEAGGCLVDLDGQCVRYNQARTQQGILVAAPRHSAAAFAARAKKAFDSRPGVLSHSG